METTSTAARIAKTVFVANYAGHDYSKAERYGTVKFVTKGYVSFGNLERLKYLITEALHEAQEDDWLLLSGAASLCVLAALNLLVRFGRVNLLVFDKKSDEGDGDYRELYVTTDNIQKLWDVVLHPAIVRDVQQQQQSSQDVQE